jgi:hypothetical protein
MLYQLRVVEDAEVGLGVTYVDREQHGAADAGIGLDRWPPRRCM